MAETTIGIKLADGTFFPVLEEGAPASKILDLTTVRDDQTSVQINLFRSQYNSIEDAEYVGTLIIEDIENKPSGEPTIELTISLDENDELSAEAVDLDSGSRQVLNVSLDTLDKDSLYTIPDFDLTPVNSDYSLGEDPNHENVVLDATVPGNAPEGLYDMRHDEEEKKSGVFMPAWLCVLILVVGVAALVLALLVSARVMLSDSPEGSAPAAPAPVVESSVVPVVEPEPVPVAEPEEVTPPPAQESPAVVVVEEPVVPAQPEPAAEAKPIRYKIKWGDTLWDLADAYYRNPWNYKIIAKHNKIRNPNLIIAGTWLEIPPR